MECARDRTGKPYGLDSCNTEGVDKVLVQRYIMSVVDGRNPLDHGACGPRNLDTLRGGA